MRYFSRMRGSGIMKNIVASSRRMWPKWTRWQVATAAQTGVRLWSRSMSTSASSPSLHSLHFFLSNPFLQMSKSDVKEASYWNITSDGRTSPTQTPPFNWSNKQKDFTQRIRLKVSNVIAYIELVVLATFSIRLKLWTQCRPTFMSIEEIENILLTKTLQLKKSYLII